MDKVLYVNHRKQQCGVYEFGKDIGRVIALSTKYEMIYCECDSFRELKRFYRKVRPKVIIYNYTPITMAWLNKSNKFDIPKTFKLKAIHIGTIHEAYQKLADNVNDLMFDFYIAADPTLMLKNPIVFKTGRLLPGKPKELNGVSNPPVIGSFGFATQGKGFDKIINLVQEEFNEATIRLNIPFAKFGDEKGDNAKRIAKQCRDLIYKKSINLIIDHTYLTNNDLLDFLSKNSINVFLYDDMESRGISSAADWALAAGKPVAISKSRLFRHLYQCKPSICVAENSLQEILKNGTLPLQKVWREWTEENLIWEFEEIVTKSLNSDSKSNRGIRNAFHYYPDKLFKKIGLRTNEDLIFNQWTKTEDQYTYHDVPFKKYEEIEFLPNDRLNRILDNEARDKYKMAISFLEQNFPYLIQKKISEANIQQAFVLDTAVRLSKLINQPVKFLAVGSFEDTAVEALKMLNCDIDEVDPIINYDLHTYLSKPSVKKGGIYDIVVSTSVIEHVKDDEQFVKDIAYLLKPGGYAILTCDYKDQYLPGDDIPEVDFRFYTQRDLRERLIGVIPECMLVDSPEWDCPNPDFFFVNRYNYTFASFVFKKR